MDKLNLEWKATTLKGIKQYLSFINPLAKTKLSPMEIEVLSAFLFVDHTYRSFPKEVRNTMLFSKDTRKKMVRYLNTSQDAFNNTISSLYKKGYLDKTGKLKSRIPFNNEGKVVVHMAIELEDDKSENFMND